MDDKGAAKSPAVKSTLERWLLMQPPTVSPVHRADVESLEPMLVAPFRAEDCTRKPVVINNLVFRVDTAATIQFLPLFGSLMGVRRKRVKFPQALVRFGNADTDRWETLIVYTSGVFVLCGMRSEMTAIRALQTFRVELQQSNIPIGLSSFTPVNVVVNVSMPFDVDIEAANVSKQLLESSLTPDDFPGMTFKMRRVQVLAFANGRCVLTGADDFLEMELVRSMVQDALLPFALERPKNAPTGGARRKAGTSSAGGKASSGASKRAQKGRQSADSKKKAGKDAAQRRGGATATPGTVVRRPRRPRAAPAGASVVAADESRAGGRARGVAFQLTSKLVLRPNQEIGSSDVTAASPK